MGNYRFTLSDFDRFPGKFAFQCEDLKFREVIHWKSDASIVVILIQMQLLELIFIKPHGIFLQTILKDLDLSHADIEGFLKTINEDLEILWPQMTYVMKRIESHKSRLSNAKWCTCRITLTHLIDCMIQVLPAIQAALNDCIHKESLDNADRGLVNAKPAKLNQFRLDPKRIIQKMERITDKTAESKDTRLRILSDAAELFSSMILICNRWRRTMVTAELGSKS